VLGSIVFVAVRAAVAPALEQVLQADADLALDRADRLLQVLGEDWVGLVDSDFVSKLLGVLEHQDCLSLEVPVRSRSALSA
jgi:hypothetical protein